MKRFKNDILKTITKNDECAIWYLGQEGFLIKHCNKYFLFDPYLSDYVDKHCSSSIQWKRNYPAPISGDDLDFVDYVFCSHSHFDHADPETISKIAKVNNKALFIVPSPISNIIEKYGIKREQIINAFADKEIIFDKFSVIPIPSAHESFHLNKEGSYYELGFILKLGNKSIFHAGDMCMYDGLIDRLKNIYLAFLPINGRDYFRKELGIIGNFDQNEAVLLAKYSKIKIIVPMHYDLYNVNCTDINYFYDSIKKHNNSQEYHVFNIKEKLII